jgi:hypothetical protein
MSLERLAELAGETVDRRRLLRRIGALSLGGTFAALVDPQTAGATVGWYCCNLCYDPGSCNQACTWCWVCCEGNTMFECCEGYTYTGLCDGTCNGVLCSRGRIVGCCVC